MYTTTDSVDVSSTTLASNATLLGSFTHKLNGRSAPQAPCWMS